MALQSEEEFIQDGDGYVDVCVGTVQMQLLDGHYVSEHDYRVSGEVWRVHKGDADPYPSKSHAHCVGGSRRFVGLTLHLGTAELYDKRKPLGRKLEENQFKRLIDLIQPKFPDIKLPLASQGEE